MKNNKGFTLVELLVVIAIIGILSTVSALAFSGARTKAKDTKVRADIHQLRTALVLLESDTSKWPNGCPIGFISNPEVSLDTIQAGINQRPNVGDQGDGCFWASEDIARWNGPYIETPIIKDSWGNSYYFDPDYYPYRGCASEPEQSTVAVIGSYGPNGDGVNVYDCDDIFVQID